MTKINLKQISPRLPVALFDRIKIAARKCDVRRHPRIKVWLAEDAHLGE